MPKLIKPLTATQVNKEKPHPTKAKDLRDGKGLTLRIMPNGSKTWYLNYLRPYTKKRNMMSLGSLDKITLKRARELRAKYREMLSQNLDPQIEIKKSYKEKQLQLKNTFKNIAQEWLNSRTNNDINSSQEVITDKYAKEIWRSLENYVLPVIGDKPITEIERIDLTQMLKPLETSGKLEATKRVSKRVEWVFEYAFNHGVLPVNTARDLYRAFSRGKKQNFPTIEPKELPALMQSIQSANIQLQTKLLIEWQLHTITRPSEASGAMWSEINLNDKTWTIPEHRMKKRSKHVIPLTEQTIQILETLKSLNSNREHLFPNRNKPREPMNSQTVNMALKRMGYHKRLVAHGLRSLASTTLNEQGFNRDVIEAALAHGDKNIIRGTYNRTTYLKQRIKLMEWWSEHIQQASIGGDISGGVKNLRIVK